MGKNETGGGGGGYQPGAQFVSWTFSPAIKEHFLVKHVAGE